MLCSLPANWRWHPPSAQWMQPRRSFASLLAAAANLAWKSGHLGSSGSPCSWPAMGAHQPTATLDSLGTPEPSEPRLWTRTGACGSRWCAMPVTKLGNGKSPHLPAELCNGSVQSAEGGRLMHGKLRQLQLFKLWALLLRRRLLAQRVSAQAASAPTSQANDVQAWPHC